MSRGVVLATEIVVLVRREYVSLGWPACLDEIAVGKAGLVQFREAGTLVLQ